MNHFSVPEAQYPTSITYEEVYFVLEAFRPWQAGCIQDRKIMQKGAGEEKRE